MYDERREHEELNAALEWSRRKPETPKQRADSWFCLFVGALFVLAIVTMISLFARGGAQ